MKADIEKQLINNEVILPKELFPKLNQHYKDLSKEDANIIIIIIIVILHIYMNVTFLTLFFFFFIVNRIST